MHLSRKPRGAASTFIIVALLFIIIALVVWYAFWGRPKAQSPSTSVLASLSPSVAKPVNAYEGWKTYTLKYEKFSFQYPKEWTLTDTTKSIGDSVRVVSPEGFTVAFSTNIWGIGGGPCVDCKNFEMTKSSILGEKTGVNIIGTSEGAQAIALSRDEKNSISALTCSVLCTLPGKNSSNPDNGNKPGLIIAQGAYILSDQEARQTGSSLKSLPYETFKADNNVTQARLIFASMNY